MRIFEGLFTTTPGGQTHHIILLGVHSCAGFLHIPEGILLEWFQIKKCRSFCKRTVKKSRQVLLALSVTKLLRPDKKRNPSFLNVTKRIPTGFLLGFQFDKDWQKECTP
jgi:hypothetical protein